MTTQNIPYKIYLNELELACIAAQRYNRPRIVRLLERKNCRRKENPP